MKKSFLSLALIFAFFISANAQTTNSFFLKLGGAYTSFQDTKYSKVPYNGGGIAFNLGFERENSKSIWETGLQANVGSESAATNETTALSVHSFLYFKYLRKINDRLSVGGNWNILGLYFRDNNGLGNNSKYYLSSSNLMASANYRMNKFDFGMELGILSWVKEGFGFAFSAPQNVLEDGEFDYQNEETSDPFGFDYFELRGPLGHFVLKTNISYQLNERFEVGYQWTARHFAEVENYPVTIGQHNVTIRWNFIHRTKDRVEVD